MLDEIETEEVIVAVTETEGVIDVAALLVVLVLLVEDGNVAL